MKSNSQPAFHSISDMLESVLGAPSINQDLFFFFKTPLGIFRGLSARDLLFDVKLIDLDSRSKIVKPAITPLQLETERQFNAYFRGTLQRFDLPLALQTLSPFAKAVTDHLMEVPFGETTTYKELAALAGKPNNARAVGTVMAHNAWLIAVPCHRVLSSSGLISGFSAPGGADTKVWLLKHEGHHISDYKIVGKKEK